MADAPAPRGSSWPARLLALGAFALLIGGAARQEITRTATISDLAAGEDAKPIYEQVSRYRRLPDQITEATTEIRDPARGLIVRETATFRGSRVDIQNYTDYLAGMRYRMERREDGKLAFTAVALHDQSEPEESVETPEGCWISGPALEPFFREHWNELLTGKTVFCEVVAIDRQKLYGFDFRAEATGKINGREAVLVEMAPTNLFVSMGMKPIRIFVDLKSGRLLRWVGRTPLHVRDGDELDSLDAIVNFR